MLYIPQFPAHKARGTQGTLKMSWSKKKTPSVSRPLSGVTSGTNRTLCSPLSCFNPKPPIQRIIRAPLPCYISATHDKCHCTVCQNWSGAPYQWMVLFPANKASIVKGADSVSISKTSDALDRARCKASRLNPYFGRVGPWGGGGCPPVFRLVLRG